MFFLGSVLKGLFFLAQAYSDTIKHPNGTNTIRTILCQFLTEKSTPEGRETLLRRRNGLPRTATGRGLSCCRARAAAARTAAWRLRTTRWRRSCWPSWARARWGAASASGRRSHKTSSAHSRNRSVGCKEFGSSWEKYLVPRYRFASHWHG